MFLKLLSVIVFIRIFFISSVVALSSHYKLTFFSQRPQHNLASQKLTLASSLAAAGLNVSHVSLVNHVLWNSSSQGVSSVRMRQNVGASHELYERGVWSMRP